MRESAGRKRRVDQLPDEPRGLAHFVISRFADITRSPNHQKRKYLWARGRTLAGSDFSVSPSAVTTYVSGSTVIAGSASLSFMSRLVSGRHLSTAARRLPARSVFAIPCSRDARETNASEIDSIAR